MNSHLIRALRKGYKPKAKPAKEKKKKKNRNNQL